MTDKPKLTPEQIAAVFDAADSGKLTPEQEARFVVILKAEFLLLAGAALAACESGDTRGLFDVVKMLNGPKGIPFFKHGVDIIEKRRQAEEAKAAELNKPAPKKATGPSPWSV